MNIKAETQYGAFAIAVEGEFTDDQIKALAVEGLVKRLLSQNGGNADKALGGFDGKTIKRPADFRRGNIAYSEANADVLAGKLASITFGSDVVRLATSVVEYVNNGEMTMAVKVIKTKTSASQLRALADKVGFDGDDDDLTSDNAEFRVAVANYIRGI